MKLIYSLGWLGVLVLFSACTTLRLGTEFASGREAMFAGNYGTEVRLTKATYGSCWNRTQLPLDPLKL